MAKFLDLNGLETFLAKVKDWVNTLVNSTKSSLQSSINNKVDKTTTVNGHPLNGNVTVTKSDVSLGNVTNDAQVKRSEMGVASGVATLGSDGKLTSAQLPAFKSVNGTSVVGSGTITIDLTLYKVVEELPKSGIDSTKIYLVKSAGSGESNIYTEYMYVNSKWEKLGEHKSDVDLTPYVKFTDVATSSKAGAMSSTDKAKLDGIATGANKTTVDSSLSTTSTNPVQNKVINSSFSRIQPRYSFSTSDDAPYNYIHLFRIANKSNYSGIKTEVVLKSRYHAATIYIDITTSNVAYGSGKSSITITKDIPNGRTCDLYYKETVQTSNYNYYDIYYKSGAWNSGCYELVSANGLSKLLFENKSTALDALPSGYVTISSTPVGGNSSSATKLQTARKINGTNFDGSADITTANWGTSRTLTIGNSGKSVNGSGNVSWSLSEIGAAASSHIHSISNITNLQSTLDGKAASSHTHAASQVTGLTANRALVSDSSGHPAVSAVTSTELGYLDGVTSSIQTQLNGKAASSHSHSAFGGATSSAAGSAGFVPAPAAGNQSKYLRGDGTWQVPTNTTYGLATTSANGLLRQLNGSTSQYMRGDGTWATPPNTVYTHPTSPGNKHIPSGGSSGQILRWSADGTAVWGNDNNTTYSAGTGLSLSGTTFNLDQATSSERGGIKIGFPKSDKNYPVALNENGQAYVNVPWTDTNTVYTHPSYTSRSSGLYKITVDSTGHVSAATAVSKSDITALGIPGSDTNTTYSIATASTAGLVKPVSVITKPTLQSVTTTAGRYYQVQMSSDGNMFVNVPWIDTNTTYSLPLAASYTRGGIKIGYTSTTNNRAVQLSSEKAYVNIPTATSSITGLMSSTLVSKLNGIASGATADSAIPTSVINALN